MNRLGQGQFLSLLSDSVSPTLAQADVSCYWFPLGVMEEPPVTEQQSHDSSMTEGPGAQCLSLMCEVWGSTYALSCASMSKVAQKTKRNIYIKYLSSIYQCVVSILC